MIAEMKDKNIIFFSRLHWIIFFWPIVGLVAALIVTFYAGSFREIGCVLIAFTLIWMFMTWVRYYFSSLTIKKNQVILRTGVIVRQTIDIPLNKIEAIDIRQSILGSLLSYGLICITGTGGTRRVINFLHDPLKCRHHIEQLIGQQQSNN